MEDNTIIKVVNKDIVNKIKEYFNSNKSFEIFIKAYNRLQQDHINEAADYIFNLEDNEDVKKALDRGLNVSLLAYAWNLGGSDVPNGNYTRYFFYNHITQLKVLTPKQLEEQLLNTMEEIVDNVMAYPYDEEYRAIYKLFITPIVEEKLYEY